jgi:hypothetical protein
VDSGVGVDLGAGVDLGIGVDPGVGVDVLSSQLKSWGPPEGPFHGVPPEHKSIPLDDFEISALRQFFKLLDEWDRRIK